MLSWIKDRAWRLTGALAIAVIMLGLAILLMGASGCPVKPPKPPEPPSCPATCPPAAHCTDPAVGCVLIPAPGPECRCDQGGPCCGCWHCSRSSGAVSARLTSR